MWILIFWLFFWTLHYNFIYLCKFKYFHEDFHQVFCNSLTPKQFWMDNFHYWMALLTTAWIKKWKYICCRKRAHACFDLFTCCYFKVFLRRLIMLSTISGNPFYVPCCWVSTSFIFVQNEKCRYVTLMLICLLVQHSVQFALNQYMLRLMYSDWNLQKLKRKAVMRKGWLFLRMLVCQSVCCHPSPCEDRMLAK